MFWGMSVRFKAKATCADRHVTGRRGVVRLTRLMTAVAAASVVAACGPNGVNWPTEGRDSRIGPTCPRPPGTDNSHFGDQEREVRHFRKLAFSNDFFAQIELSNRYMGLRATDENLTDPVEAAVWLVMALSNPEGYAPINRTARNGQHTSRFDKCLAAERANGYRQLERLLARMDTSERDQVRNRVIYVQSQLGADGFRTLGRLYDTQYGPMGEPADNREGVRATMRDPAYARPNVISLFQRNDVDAYLYNYKASATGDVGAYVMLKDFERSSPERERSKYGAFVETKAKRWVAPFEFYPPQAPAGGVPHADESRPRGDIYGYALTRMDELPFIHVGRALVYLDLTEQVAQAPSEVSDHTVMGLRAILGRKDGGRLNNLDRVRAIQLAATNGSAQAQLVLAVMYSEGVGVPADYARAFHWYQEAEKQGSAEARYAMSTYFALGLSGVADQDKASAVVLRLGSALDGYRPSAARLQAVLNEVSRSPHR